MLYQIGLGTATLAGNNSGVGITISGGIYACRKQQYRPGTHHRNRTRPEYCRSTSTRNLDIATQNGDTAVANVLPGQTCSERRLFGVGEASGVSARST